MALVVDISINSTVIQKVAAQRISGTSKRNASPDDVFTYKVVSFTPDDGQWVGRELGTTTHRYGDGAAVLAAHALDMMRKVS